MPYYVYRGRLEAIRRRNDLTQQDLAEEAGVHVNTISNAEVGWPVQRKTVRAIARVLILEPREIGFYED